MEETFIEQKAAPAKIVDRSDVVVVGGGPAGHLRRRLGCPQRRQRHPARALHLSRRTGVRRHGAAARRHAQRPGNHRPGHLHGDDRAHAEDGAVRRPARQPTASPTSAAPTRCGGNGRAGASSTSTPITCRTRSAIRPPSTPTATSAPPTTWSTEAGVKLRLHSWFSSAIVEDGAIKGVICESKDGRQAIMGDVVIDTTGDLDVAASAGAQFQEGSFILTRSRAGAASIPTGRKSSSSRTRKTSPVSTTRPSASSAAAGTTGG